MAASPPPAANAPLPASVDVEFGQYALPPLHDGHFTVTVTQKILIRQAEVQSFTTTREFEVLGPRYALGPSDIDSVFPPSGAQGEFSTIVPHVVLAAPTLPWQRSPSAHPQPPEPAAPQPSWLAILVFDENDPPPAPQVIALRDLGRNGAIFAPVQSPEFGETPDQPVAVIDVPIGLFNAIAPSADDLEWSASTRRVDIAQKALSAESGRSGDYAVVFGTRLPVPGNTATAHLVSLEDYADFLPAADGTPSAAFPSGTTLVRLVTLNSWTFTALDLQQSFKGLLAAVDLSPPTLQRPFIPPAGGATMATGRVETAFGLGYVGLNETLRDGSDTVSWYRGPLAPLGVGATLLPPYSGADQLQLFDPGIGMWDVSYAAAWQLGRLMGLRDTSYAAALYRWKLGEAEGAAAALEGAIIDSLLPTLPPYDPPIDLGAASEAVHRRLRQAASLVGAAISGLGEAAATPAMGADRHSMRKRARAEDLAAAVGGAPPSADPPPPVPGTDAEQIVNWLTQLHMLRGVPFNYLVPDVAMLPPESLRFFQVDDNWVEALIDGAFSIGFCGATDNNDARKRLRPLAAGGKARARGGSARRALLRRRGVEAPERGPAPAAPELLSGFLLRSAVVAGWPGLEVRPFADAAATQPLDLVRLEIVGPSIMLCLIAGAPRRIDIQEASEALHFGVVEAGTAWAKDLRWADSASDRAAGAFNGAQSPVVPRSGTDPACRVIALPAIAAAMDGLIWANPNQPGVLTAAQFALEMVEGVERVSFVLQSGKQEKGGQ